MNDPFLAEQARNLVARREVAHERSPSGRIRAIYQLVHGRAATADELSLALRFIEEQMYSMSVRLSAGGEGESPFRSRPARTKASTAVSGQRVFFTAGTGRSRGS